MFKIKTPNIKKKEKVAMTPAVIGTKSSSKEASEKEPSTNQVGPIDL
jgi:hypothetical protein